MAVTVMFYLITWLVFSVAGAIAAGTTMLTATTTTKPGCQKRCGDLTIPYPFGIEPGCSLTPFYSLTCNTSYNPPRAFLTNNDQPQNYSERPRSIHEIISISESQIRVRNMVLSRCYDPLHNKSAVQGMVLPPDSPFVFSAKSNKIFSVGCGFTTLVNASADIPIDICSSYCNKTEVLATVCTGDNGCRENMIRRVLREFYIQVYRPRPESISFDYCGYSFLGEANAFTFQGESDFKDANVFVERTLQDVPLVVDWVIGNQTCKEARANASSYACQNNTDCVNSGSNIGGYHCVCVRDYEGNPYLLPGCTKIVECSFGYEAGPNGCVPKLYVKLTIGLGIAFLTLVISVSWIYLMIRKQRSLKMKESLFTKNGGLLLKGQLSSMSQGGVEPIKIFTEKELKMATNNFGDECIAGKGGSGIVYKGTLEDKGFIAIKKAIIMDENQIEHFINELVILSQINHRNVVKLLGCCLEVEVPLLIYEFIPNGALFNHLHSNVHGAWLDWRHCVRIVSEIANALAYLHCSANFPIIHRDVKSANVLLDDNYTVKLSDFGASRLVPLDQTKLCTAVQGTLGYLDPDYMFTSQLTEKSDVYSFGVLVAEILTRKKAVFSLRGTVFRNLATYFVESVGKGQVSSIVDPQLANNARIQEIAFIAEIVCQCLNEKGEDRPMMKDIAAQLDRLANQVLADA